MLVPLCRHLCYLYGGFSAQKKTCITGFRGEKITQFSLGNVRFGGSCIITLDTSTQATEGFVCTRGI